MEGRIERGRRRAEGKEGKQEEREGRGTRWGAKKRSEKEDMEREKTTNIEIRRRKGGRGWVRRWKRRRKERLW